MSYTKAPIYSEHRFQYRLLLAILTIESLIGAVGVVSALLLCWENKKIALKIPQFKILRLIYIFMINISEVSHRITKLLKCQTKVTFFRMRYNQNLVPPEPRPFNKLFYSHLRSM